MGKIHPLVGSTRVYTSPAKHGHGYRAFGFVRKLPDDRGMVSSSISGYVMLSTGMVLGGNISIIKFKKRQL